MNPRCPTRRQSQRAQLSRRLQSQAPRQLCTWLIFNVGQSEITSRRMKTRLLLGLLLIMVFATGFTIGHRFSVPERKIELHFSFDPKAGYGTAYTFYRDSDGKEVKHGDSYAFDVTGRLAVRGRYENGNEVGGKSRFN